MAVYESNMTEFKMAIIIKLSEKEWVKFFCANDWKQIWQVWVSLRGNTKMAESKMDKYKMAEFKMAKFKMAESKIAEFKMASIFQLSENKWVWVRLN